MSPAARLKAMDILMVEDNPGDVRLTREALARATFHHQLAVAKDGVQALAYLRGEAPYAQASRPDLILLDLNLPRKDGREVLAEIKADERLRRIPVVIFTSSRSERDIARAYDLRANAYVTKPLDLDQFLRVVRSIQQFWLETVTLPQPDEP